MQRKLNACRQSRLQHPLRKCRCVQHSKHRTEEHRMTPVRQRMPLNHAARPIKVRSVPDDKFHLVVRPEPRNVAEIHRAGFAAPGTFQVHDRDHAVGDHRQVTTAVRFHQNGPSALRAQPERQVRKALLQQRFPASNLRDRGTTCRKGSHELVHRRLPPGVVSAAGVAVQAAQVTTAQPDEETGQPGPGRLPLNGHERLGDLDGRAHTPSSSQ